MNTHSSKHSPAAARRTWMMSGIAMLLAGIVLFATITLSAVGIMLMILGLGTMIAAHIRA